MAAPLSIVVPTLDAAPALPGLLVSLMPGLGAGLVRELIVSDGGSTDATLAIAEEAGARIETGPPGRGVQLARGARAAAGEWFLFLHADSRLSPDWTDATADHIAANPHMAAHFRLGFDAAGPMARLTAGWANFRAGRLGLPYGDQGLLIPRGLYLEVGGFEPVPLMEDVALVRKLRHIAALDATVTTSAERYLRNGWLRQGGANLWRLARYLAGASPERLAAGYRRR